MSGPDINRPRPGSNGIGRFVIGISPIGTIEAFDLWATIIAQFANSPTITQLLQNFDAYIDQTKNLDAFYDLMRNVATAKGYGLDVWGQIVGVTRTLNLPGSQKYFGLKEATTLSADPFNQSPFYSGAPLGTNFQLSDDGYRILIMAKALANVSDGSINSINQILVRLFPNRGNAYVTDGNNMSMTYTFKFVMTALEIAIVSQSGVLPKPVGVAATVVQVQV